MPLVYPDKAPGYYVLTDSGMMLGDPATLQEQQLLAQYGINVPIVGNAGPQMGQAGSLAGLELAGQPLPGPDTSQTPQMLEEQRLWNDFQLAQGEFYQARQQFVSAGADEAERQARTAWWQQNVTPPSLRDSSTWKPPTSTSGFQTWYEPRREAYEGTYNTQAYQNQQLAQQYSYGTTQAPTPVPTQQVTTNPALLGGTSIQADDGYAARVAAENAQRRAQESLSGSIVGGQAPTPDFSREAAPSVDPRLGTSRVGQPLPPATFPPSQNVWDLSDPASAAAYQEWQASRQFDPSVVLNPVPSGPMSLANPDAMIETIRTLGPDSRLAQALIQQLEASGQQVERLGDPARGRIVDRTVPPNEGPPTYVDSQAGGGTAGGGGAIVDWTSPGGTGPDQSTPWIQPGQNGYNYYWSGTEWIPINSGQTPAYYIDPTTGQPVYPGGASPYGGYYDTGGQFVPYGPPGSAWEPMLPEIFKAQFGPPASWGEYWQNWEQKEPYGVPPEWLQLASGVGPEDRQQIVDWAQGLHTLPPDATMPGWQGAEPGTFRYQPMTPEQWKTAADPVHDALRAMGSGHIPDATMENDSNWAKKLQSWASYYRVGAQGALTGFQGSEPLDPLARLQGQLMGQYNPQAIHQALNPGYYQQAAPAAPGAPAGGPAGISPEAQQYFDDLQNAFGQIETITNPGVSPEAQQYFDELDAIIAQLNQPPAATPEAQQYFDRINSTISRLQQPAATTPEAQQYFDALEAAFAQIQQSQAQQAAPAASNAIVDSSQQGASDYSRTGTVESLRRTPRVGSPPADTGLPAGNQYVDLSTMTTSELLAWLAQQQAQTYDPTVQPQPGGAGSNPMDWNDLLTRWRDTYDFRYNVLDPRNRANGPNEYPVAFNLQGYNVPEGVQQSWSQALQQNQSTPAPAVAGGSWQELPTQYLFSDLLQARNQGVATQLQQRAAGQGAPDIYGGLLGDIERARGSLVDQAAAAYRPQAYELEKQVTDQTNQLLQALTNAQMETQRFTQMAGR